MEATGDRRQHLERLGVGISQLVELPKAGVHETYDSGETFRHWLGCTPPGRPTTDSVVEDSRTEPRV
jgi:hypothetical protein